ncbi:2OG-Fe(II) oxygenase [Bowmanella denitrificans]|uniref:2OG-Fe(II) oxygenase n=1 Tax=Bowmanella denitrificans TaxID=366582 RepID=UPI001C0EF49E|nr:2OG-Fe(II) oxygenase [Bowmanella denitrificans]
MNIDAILQNSKPLALLDADLLAHNYSVMSGSLDVATCKTLSALFDERQWFRNEVRMEKHGFGRGRYRYFAYPLPAAIRQLREGFYTQLAPLANLWAERLGLATRWPPTLDEFLASNHNAGQTKATPLMLDYGPGDYNCLHQDKYGECYFPFQVLILLSQPGQDFGGGELMLVENQPRKQSRGQVVPLTQGQAVIFLNSAGLVPSANGFRRSQLRHGVSEILTGHRRSLGLIFHDAL